MSDFQELSIVFMSPKTETVTIPLEISGINRLWRKLTRKPLPIVTQKVPYLHTVTLDDSQEPYACVEYDGNRAASGLDSVCERFANAGYTIASVIVRDTFGSTELVSDIHYPSISELVALYDSIKNDDNRYAAYVAYVTVFGFDSEMSESWMDDRLEGTYDSPEDFAKDYSFSTSTTMIELGRYGGAAYDQETASYVTSSVMENLPDYLSIDWTDTAEALDSDGFEYVRHNGETYVFWE